MQSLHDRPLPNPVALNINNNEARHISMRTYTQGLQATCNGIDPEICRATIFLLPGVFFWGGLVEQSEQPLHAFHLHFVDHGFAYLAHSFEHSVTITGVNEWWHSGGKTGDYNGVRAMFILPENRRQP